MPRFTFYARGPFAALLLAACSLSITAQDEKKKTSDENPVAETDKRSDKPIVEKQAAEGSPAEVFAAKMAEWKNLMKELRDAKAKFDISEPGSAEDFQKKWKDLIAKGHALVPGLRDVAKAAYVAAPNEDRQLTRFLAKLLEDAASRDQFEIVADLGEVLIENNAGIKEAPDLVGAAAFVLNDFEKAQKYLQMAQANGSLSKENGGKYLGEVENYRAIWAEEEAIRKKETEANDLPRVKIVTSKGEMTAELFENEAPETVGNFISLIEQGFYNGLAFHRVLPGFMAQAGCPKGDGTGGPGYKIYCECTKSNFRKHFRGTLSMAHAGRNTGGSQFFLTFVPTFHLNGQHTAFARIIEGLDVLEKLQRIDPMAEGEKPTPDRIEKIEVLRKRDHEYVPNKVQ